MGKFGRGGYTAPAGQAPANPPSGGSGVKSPQLSLPESKPALVSLGDTVLVKTPHAIDGQREHAAIVTRVHPGDVVNVLLLPGSSEPYSVELVRAAKTGAAISWRFRS